MASPSIRQERTGSSASCCHDEGEALGKIVAVAGIEPHAAGVAQREDAEAVVLDLVQPAGAGRQLLGWGMPRRATPT